MNLAGRVSDRRPELVEENGARLLSPDAAAAYLGLGSRWAIYRLVSSGQVPAMKLAGKLRIDRKDLDALIELLKQRSGEKRTPESGRPPSAVPRALRPLNPAQHR